MSDGIPVSLTEWGDQLIRNLQSELFTGVPAQVVAYDPVTNTIDAQIVVKHAVFDRYHEREYEEFPILPSVPVLLPRAGGKVVRLPIEPGDFVWLAFSQASLAEWRTTGQVSEPTDARRHSIGYAFAIPGAFPDVSPLSPTDVAEVAAGALIVGEDGGTQIIVGGTVPGIRLGKAATSPVAKATPLVTAFTELATQFAALGASLGGNPSGQAACTAAASACTTAAGAVASVLAKTQ
jgi:hypothetical protein